MTGASARAALLSALTLLPPGADAGVGLSGAVSSCPAVIKNAITAEMLLSEEFVPWDAVGAVDAAVYTVDAIDSVIVADKDTVEAELSTVDTLNAVDTVYADSTVNAVSAVDIDTTGGNDVVNAVGAVGGKASRIWKKVRFGRRAAFNHSQVSNVVIRVYSHDGESFLCDEYGNRAEFGIGFEVAGVTNFVLSDALALNFSPGVVFRKPINTAVVGASEVGLSFPVVAEWGPFGGFGSVRGASGAFAGAWPGGFDLRQLRLFGGIWVGVPLYAWVKWNGEEGASFGERSAADFGLVCGVGVYVSDRAFIDAKGIFGLSGYDGVEGRRLNQLAIGVNYVK